MGAAAVCPLNLVSPDAFPAVGITCIVMLYLAYAMVTGPTPCRRMRRQWPVEGGPQVDGSGRPLFWLGRWGLPVDVPALVHGLFMTVDLPGRGRRCTTRPAATGTSAGPRFCSWSRRSCWARPTGGGGGPAPGRWRLSS